jgi:hypothetical protein
VRQSPVYFGLLRQGVDQFGASFGCLIDAVREFEFIVQYYAQIFHSVNLFQRLVVICGYFYFFLFLALPSCNQYDDAFLFIEAHFVVFNSCEV